MQKTWVQSLCWEDPLEKEMATHSNILAWKIPWAEEPGGGATVHGVTKLDTTERLCTYTYTCTAPLAGAPGSLPPPGSLPRSLLLPSHLTFRWPLSVSLGCSTQWSLKNATNSMWNFQQVLSSSQHVFYKSPWNRNSVLPVFTEWALS